MLISLSCLTYNRTVVLLPYKVEEARGAIGKGEFEDQVAECIHVAGGPSCGWAWIEDLNI